MLANLFPGRQSVVVTMPENYIPEVRRQYEALPYPPRDPKMNASD